MVGSSLPVTCMDGYGSGVVQRLQVVFSEGPRWSISLGQFGLAMGAGSGCDSMDGNGITGSDFVGSMTSRILSVIYGGSDIDSDFACEDGMEWLMKIDWRGNGSADGHHWILRSCSGNDGGSECSDTTGRWLLGSLIV